MRRQTRAAARPTGNGSVAAIAFLSAVLSLALYSPSLSFEFVNWDDWEYVLTNPHLGELDLEFARWCLTAYRVGNWHPATLLSYGLDHAFWGFDARGFHLTNVLLHAANAALVVWLAWLLFRRTHGPSSGSVFAVAVVGFLFACHPLHVESVAWISERKDVLYSFFWLASLIAWFAFVDSGADTRRRKAAYSLALASYAASALSKPMAVTLPLVLLILDVYPLRRFGPGRNRIRIAVVEKLPFYLISAAVSAVTLVAQQASGSIGKADLSLPDRLWVAVKASGLYLAKWIAPVDLVPLYPLDPEVLPLTWPYSASLAALLALVGVAVVLRNRVPAIAACLAFCAVTLLPVLGLVEFGHHGAADRYTYLAMLGPSILAGAAAAAAWRRSARTRWIAAGVAAVALVGLGWRTTDQVFVWKDSVSLWTHVAVAYPGSAIAHYNLGHAHAIAGEATRAETEWKRTLEIDATHTPSLYELGAAAGRNGEYEKARRYFLAVVSSDPNHSLGRINLAMVLDELGDWRGASRHYREFLRTAPPSFVDYVEHARSRLEAGGADGS